MKFVMYPVTMHIELAPNVKVDPTQVICSSVISMSFMSAGPVGDDQLRAVLNAIAPTAAEMIKERKENSFTVKWKIA